MAVIISFNEDLNWTITGARNLFKTQADLDVFTKKYIAAEIDELLEAVSMI